MNRISLAILVLFSLNAQAQTPPGIEWQKCLGGPGFESAYASARTSDGGYIIGGTTDSNGGQVTGFQGGATDFWVAKLDAAGVLQWQKALGGSATDQLEAVQQTSDGGYILAGGTNSNDGDVSGNHGDADCWVVKLDALGSIQWQRTYGGSAVDGSWGIRQTVDGGYVFAGNSNSNDGDVIGNDGTYDMWVVRIDPQGDIVWQRTYGGEYGEIAFALDLTNDGGVVLAGYAESNTGDVTGNNGGNDFWVVKLDGAGDLQWQKCLGGSSLEIAVGVVQTSDGGYAAVGWTYSVDGDVTGAQGSADYWITRLDPTGELVWQKALGGTAEERAYGVQPSTDGGLIVVGFTNSADGDVSQALGGYDLWMVKLDSQGQLLWENSLGGSAGEGARSILSTTDGGYLLVGATSSNNGDVSGNHGQGDFWVVKLFAEPDGVVERGLHRGSNIYPNPATSSVTIDISLIPTGPLFYRWLDGCGHEVGRGAIPRSSVTAGTVTLSTADLSPGTYLLKMVAGPWSGSATVIKVD